MTRNTIELMAVVFVNRAVGKANRGEFDSAVRSAKKGVELFFMLREQASIVKGFKYLGLIYINKGVAQARRSGAPFFFFFFFHVRGVR